MFEGESQGTEGMMKFLESKGFRGCLICGSGAFEIGPAQELVFADKDTVVVPFMCANCGYVMLISTLYVRR